MSPVTLALVVRAMATWRLTHLFMYEAGPWNIITQLREYFGVRHDDTGTPMAYPDGSVFECFLCFSIWVGAVVSWLPLGWLRAIALSAFAIWAEKAYKHGRR